MKRLYKLVGALISTAALAACGGASNGLASSTPLAIPDTNLPQSLGAQPAFGRYQQAKLASKERVLHSFTFGSDGRYPVSGLTNVGGTLYGTTYAGGPNVYGGTVFKITKSGTETVLYNFKQGADGCCPLASVINVGGTLYGTTPGGGCSNGKDCGTVFKITTSGTETVLYAFAGGADGAYPYAGLTNVNGTLYGTTAAGGGTSNGGTVFKITTSGTETVLHRFTNYVMGQHPQAGLTEMGGALYGTTFGGGLASVYGNGTVFKITTAGVFTVLYNFQGGNDGSGPLGRLANVGGTLYGTTSESQYSSRPPPFGTVFKITKSGTETVLYGFKGGKDGAEPLAGLIESGGALYGTTGVGGGGGCFSGYGCGTIFKITTSGTETVLYRFKGKPDAEGPRSPLISVNGVLYGTTYYGGTDTYCKLGCGTVFKVTP